MNITIKATKYELSPGTEAIIQKKLAAILRLVGEEKETALLEVDVEEAPPEGRSSEPCRLVARLIIGGKVLHAEAVKPTPESAADRVRSELEAEVRHLRGRAKRLKKKGGAAIKDMLRRGG